MTYQDPRLVPLPHPEVTRRSVGQVLVDLGFAESPEEGERLAVRIFPDLPGEIHLEDQP